MAKKMSNGNGAVPEEFRRRDPKLMATYSKPRSLNLNEEASRALESIVAHYGGNVNRTKLVAVLLKEYAEKLGL